MGEGVDFPAEGVAAEDSGGDKMLRLFRMYDTI